MTVLEYLDKNKEWLFSGVGVVVLGYIVSQLWRRFVPQSTRKEGAVVIVQASNQDASPTSVPQSGSQVTPAHITKVTSIALAEIIVTLDKAPPLQKDDVTKHYIGLVVQWETKLFDATKEDGDKVRLSLDFGPGDSHLVYCTVNLSDYRELGVLQKGAPITVMGRIKKIAHKSATLENVQLFFHSPLNAENA
jgi:hypothetical protein